MLRGFANALSVFPAGGDGWNLLRNLELRDREGKPAWEEDRFPAWAYGLVFSYSSLGSGWIETRLSGPPMLRWESETACFLTYIWLPSLCDVIRAFRGCNIGRKQLPAHAIDVMLSRVLAPVAVLRR